MANQVFNPTQPTIQNVPEQYRRYVSRWVQQKDTDTAPPPGVPQIEKWVQEKFPNISETLSTAGLSKDVSSHIAKYYFYDTRTSNKDIQYYFDWDAFAKEITGYTSRQEEWKATSKAAGVGMRRTILTGARGIQGQPEIALTGLKKKLGG